MENRPFKILYDNRPPKTETDDTSKSNDPEFIPLDDEDLVVGLYAKLGQETVLFAESNGKKLKVCFILNDEVKDILKRIQQSKMGAQVEPVEVNYAKVCEARKWWRELLMMMRSEYGDSR